MDDNWKFNIVKYDSQVGVREGNGGQGMEVLRVIFVGSFVWMIYHFLSGITYLSAVAISDLMVSF